MKVKAEQEIKKIIDDNNFDAKIIGGRFFLNIEVSISSLKKFLESLKDNKELRFTILTDLFAADFPEREKRFEIVYNLLSLKNNERVIIKTYCSEEELVPSVCDIFSAANWYEREIFDLFGVDFEGHPDMRRILTDYGFSGHPLRKDFPLTGYVQVTYDPAQEKVVNEPVKLQQAYRDFDFVSPWKGPENVLPGDEKANHNE